MRRKRTKKKEGWSEEAENEGAGRCVVRRQRTKEQGGVL